LKCCSNGCGKACVAATGGVKSTISCNNVRCRSGECVNTVTGPRCLPNNEITQALADQQSTYTSSSPAGSSGVEWVVVGIAAIVTLAFIALATIAIIKLK
jgi:hypothetical protein